MKKRISLFLSLLLCVCLMVAVLQAVCYASKTDPDSEPEISLILPENSAAVHSVPPIKDTEGRE